MANSFTPDFPEIWAREQQTVFYKTNVAMKIADVSFKSQLSRGDTLNRPYRSSNRIQSYVRGTAITIDDKTDTQEQLSVDKQFATGFYMDDFDKVQSNYDLIASYAQDDAVYLSNQVDADVLGEALNATSVVDDADQGNSAGDGIVLSTSNVLSVVSAAKKKLQKQNVPTKKIYGVISPEFEQILIEYGAGRDTSMGDGLNDNGYITAFYGFKLYGSNQLAGSAELAIATNPTNGDTVTIAGVTFTFVSSIGTTPGNILIGANADETRGHLVAAINDPATTSADQVALTGEDLRLVQNQFSASDDATANVATIVVKGIGVLEVSETLTDGSDGFTAARQIQHQLFGVMGNPVLIMQADPRVQIKEVPDKLGKNILNGVLYGVKTFADNAKQMVDVKIRSNNF